MRIKSCHIISEGLILPSRAKSTDQLEEKVQSDQLEEVNWENRKFIVKFWADILKRRKVSKERKEEKRKQEEKCKENRKL